MTAESTSPAPQKKKRVSISEPPLPDAKAFQVQRHRVWRACESCRRKKIKCEGNEPTCTQCIALSLNASGYKPKIGLRSADSVTSRRGGQ